LKGFARVVVDPVKCDGCGKCVELCPFYSLEIKDGRAFQSGPCFLCGGCEALCEAIRLEPLLEVRELRSLR